MIQSFSYQYFQLNPYIMQNSGTGHIRKKLPIYLGLLLFLTRVLWPISANESSELGEDLAQIVRPRRQYIETTALGKWVKRLDRRHYELSKQGILVESLDGQKVLAELNPDLPLNPASVMKVATSLVALEKLGPKHRFVTQIYGDVPIESSQRSLASNFYLLSDGNPVFTRSDVRRCARALVRQGIRRFEGDLIVIGPFSLKARYSPKYTARVFRRILRRVGIRIKGKTYLRLKSDFQEQSKVKFLTHHSDPLGEILWRLNAFSTNDVADRLGRSLGGAGEIQEFLIREYDLNRADLYVEKPSGLEYNRMTARAVIQVLRALHHQLKNNQMKMRDILPVAGIDRGTLRLRFRSPSYRGGLVGKTGTNSSKDGGVSSLAGLAVTQRYGPVLYAILNSQGDVQTYRRWQDQFLKNLIKESGGVNQPLDLNPIRIKKAYSLSPWILVSRHYQRNNQDFKRWSLGRKANLNQIGS